MQTVKTLIRCYIPHGLIWGQTVCQCPFQGKLGLNGLIILAKRPRKVSHFMEKNSFGGRADTFLFYQIFLHGENGKIKEIQSKIKELCPSANKNFKGQRV